MIKNNTDLIDWLSNWFSAECNGDWEHENQIKIETVDNPGWYLEIDLRNTSLEHLEIVNTLVEKSENDWHFYDVKDKMFRGSGDLKKLNFLLSKFREITETYN